MFKKLFTTMMLFAFCLVQANAATHNSLKAAFDELNYSLTVEWDQKDRSFYNQVQQKFARELKDLQAKGLSNQELVNFALSQVKDEKLAKNLETAFNMVQINKMNQDEARRYMTEVMNKSYSQGASWNGGAAIATVLVVVILVAVLLVVAGEARVEDGCYQVWTCDDYCAGGVCYEDCYYECI